jgi:hypothetical protein
MPPAINDEGVSLGQAPGLIQNLGPNAIFLGDAGVTHETGLKLGAGQSTVVGTKNTELYAITEDGNTADVRTLPRATAGIFGTEIEETP